MEKNVTLKRKVSLKRKVNEASEAKKEVVTTFEDLNEFMKLHHQEKTCLSDMAKKFNLPYCQSFKNEWKVWDGEKFTPNGQKKEKGNNTVVLFDGKALQKNDFYKLWEGGVQAWTNRVPKLNNSKGLSLVEKLEKELAEKEARVKEIKEKLLPAAREEAAKKKEEATKAADEKAEVNIEKTISSYQVKTGCSAVEAEENLLNKLLARQAARKATANA